MGRLDNNKILVTGAEGMLGHDICRVLAHRQIEFKGVDISDFDITNTTATLNYITDYKPGVVIHCAAYTFVDRAEHEKSICRLVNVTGTESIINACKHVNAKLIYISSDYVFNGQKGNNPHEISDTTCAVNYYGQSKVEAEESIKKILKDYFIVRSSWIFGANGRNFIKTILNMGREQNTIDVVCDQIGSPTYAHDLAEWICDLVFTNKYGIHHATNEGFCSYAQLAEWVFNKTKTDCVVNKVSSAAYKTIAKRPLNSRLSKDYMDKLGLNRLPDWQDAVKRYLKEVNLI